MPLFRRKSSKPKVAWGKAQAEAAELWRTGKFPKKATDDQKAAAEVAKTIQAFVRQTEASRSMDIKKRREARIASALSTRGMKEAPNLTKESVYLDPKAKVPLSQSELQKAMREFTAVTSYLNLQRYLEGVKFKGWLGSGWYSDDPKYGSPLKPMLKSLLSFKEFRKYWFSGMEAGPFIGFVVYPIRGALRILLLPFSIPGRMFARYMRRRYVQKQLKELKGAISSNRAQLFLAHFAMLDKMKPEKRREYYNKLFGLSDEEEKTLKKIRETKKKRREAAAA